jgi:hypothetical protein
MYEYVQYVAVGLVFEGTYPTLNDLQEPPLAMAC